MICRRHIVLGLAALTLFPPAAGAAARRYRLATAPAQAGFTFTLNGVLQTGQIPVTGADILLDPADLARTRVSAELDARRAETGLALATALIRGPGILDAERFPVVRFRSTRIVPGAAGRISQGARVTGLLTLRGVTREISLGAELYRQPGTPPGDLRLLDVRLRGALNRFDFGASAYPALAGARVGLDIRARIAVA